MLPSAAPASLAGSEELLMKAAVDHRWDRFASPAGYGRLEQFGLFSARVFPVRSSGLYTSPWFLALKVAEVVEQAGATAWSMSLLKPGL